MRDQLAQLTPQPRIRNVTELPKFPGFHASKLTRTFSSSLPPPRRATAAPIDSRSDRHRERLATRALCAAIHISVSIRERVRSTLEKCVNRNVDHAAATRAIFSGRPMVSTCTSPYVTRPRRSTSAATARIRRHNTRTSPRRGEFRVLSSVEARVRREAPAPRPDEVNSVCVERMRARPRHSSANEHARPGPLGVATSTSPRTQDPAEVQEPAGIPRSGVI
jgi:hypothetical protein